MKYSLHSAVDHLCSWLHWDICLISRDGRLQENDQILAINGIPLDQSVTQQQAIALLQQQRDRVELVVARDAAAKPRLSTSGPIQTVWLF